jgi:hypothetical protein
MIFSLCKDKWQFLKISVPAASYGACWNFVPAGTELLYIPSSHDKTQRALASFQ